MDNPPVARMFPGSAPAMEPSGEFMVGIHGRGATASRGSMMSPQGPFPETIRLTDDELQSLHWISMVNFRPFIPKRHIEKLAEGGYIREDGSSGPILTDLGMLRLVHERNKQAAR